MIPSMRLARMRLAGPARRLVVTLACLLPLAAAPSGALGQEVDIEHDGRREGYGEKLVLTDGGNNAMTWFGFGVLAVIALLALFKDAKRSHLD